MSKKSVNVISWLVVAIIIVLAIIWVCTAQTAKADDKSLASYNQLTYIGDAKHGYLYIVDITADDTQPTFGTKSWADISANTRSAGGSTAGTGRWLELPPQWAVAEISIYAHGLNGTDPVTGAFDVNAFAARKYGGAKKLFHGPVGIGNVQLSNNPQSGAALRGTAASPLADPNYKWADQVTLTDVWSLGVYKGGYSGSEIYGDILQIMFPVIGYEYLWIGVDNANWSVVDHVYIVVSGSSG